MLVRGVRDTVNPNLEIVWEQPLDLARFEVPAEATVFTRERWSGAPLAAGFRRDGKVVFWTIAPLGEKGYERFPYIPQALSELGLRPKLESRALWAFFDSSYRLRADPDYLAERWRRGGIAALHVAAWHYWEPDPQRDAYLSRLIEACHRHAILIYAWVELPHVSEQFWNDHPQWREQTATLQDAHLDWRKLMNLLRPDCAAAVEGGLQALAARFDWDGINLGELYFESLEGYSSPARFTPFSREVREAFKSRAGFDPAELYDRGSKRFHRRDAAPMRRFLDYRAELAGTLQQDWLGRLDRIRAAKPWLDLVLTHIDDRFDATMRDKLGADAARLLPVASRYGATFLIEDPADRLEPRPGALRRDGAPLQSHQRARLPPGGRTLTWWSAIRTSTPPSSRPEPSCFNSSTAPPSRSPAWPSTSRTRSCSPTGPCSPPRLHRPAA